MYYRFLHKQRIVRLQISAIIGVFVSAISFASYGQNDTKESESFVTYTEINYNDSNITFDQKLELAFSHAFGLSTYTGDNEEAFAKLAPYSANDLELIRLSATSTEYTRGAITILQDACDHYRSTPRELIDVEYLARSQEESHQASLTERKTFIAGLYVQLSPNAKEGLQKIMSSTSFGNQTGVIGKIDYVRAALANPEEFINSHSYSCKNVDVMMDELETDNQNRMQLNVMDFSSKENN